MLPQPHQLFNTFPAQHFQSAAPSLQHSELADGEDNAKSIKGVSLRSEDPHALLVSPYPLASWIGTQFFQP